MIHEQPTRPNPSDPFCAALAQRVKASGDNVATAWVDLLGSDASDIRTRWLEIALAWFSELADVDRDRYLSRANAAGYATDAEFADGAMELLDRIGPVMCRDVLGRRPLALEELHARTWPLPTFEPRLLARLLICSRVGFEEHPRPATLLIGPEDHDDLSQNRDGQQSPHREHLTKRFAPQQVTPWRPDGMPLPPWVTEVRDKAPSVVEPDPDAFTRTWLLNILAVAQRNGYTSDILSCCCELGEMLWAAGDLRAAHDYLARALAAAEVLGDDEAVSFVAGLLSRVEHYLGDDDAAYTHVVRALVIDDRSKDQHLMTAHYGTLAEIVRDRGELDEAADVLRAAVTLAEDMQDGHQLAALCNNLAEVRRQAGALDDAEHWIDRARALAKELASFEVLTVAYANLSEIELSRGDAGQACAWMMKALRVDLVCNDEARLALDCDRLADLYARLGEDEDAEVYLELAWLYVNRTQETRIRTAISDHRIAFYAERQRDDDADRARNEGRII